MSLDGDDVVNVVALVGLLLLVVREHPFVVRQVLVLVMTRFQLE